jgi:hypothetical protein
MKRKSSKSPESPLARQNSPASEKDDVAASSGGAAASSSSGDLAAPVDNLGLAVYVVDDSAKCMLCEKELNDTDYVVASRHGDTVYKRCTDCNRLQSRVQRTLQKRGDLKDRWGVMTRDQRKHFFKEHHAAMGSDVAMHITQITAHTFSSSQESGFASTGAWMDIDDLDELYKDKPDQLASIKATAKKMTCPFRGVELVEHITYNSVTNERQKSEINRNISMRQESTLKAAKKLSIASGPKAEPGGPPKLSAPAIAKLATLKESMSTLSDTIKTTAESCPEDLPKKFIDHMQLKEVEMMAYRAEIDVSIDFGRGKSSELMAGAKTVMRAAQEALVAVTNLAATLGAMG